MLARRAIFIAFSSVLLLAFASAPAVSQTEITIGTGFATGPYPLATSYRDARTQVIYLASEIRAPYRITALSLNLATVPGQTLNNFTIRMKHTMLTSYSSPAWESSDWTTVYQANETVTTTGWWTFTFSMPFLYNGSDNLMVDFSFSNASYTTAGYCCYSIPSGYRTIYQRTLNGAYGDPLAWSGTFPTPVSTVNVPNVRLTAESMIRVATPVFSPDGGAYSSSKDVTVTCTTPGATIHYTTTGIDPTESDPAAPGPITVTGPMTLKARSYKPGWLPSDLRSGVYTAAKIVRVRPTGNDENSGLSWATAKKTVGAALDAVIEGDEVWVAGDWAHLYRERITLKLGVALYGGFRGTEIVRSQRDWAANMTVLYPSVSGPVITSPPGATSTTRIDGFCIWNGEAPCGGGIYCHDSSPTIANNSICGNGASYGGGIYCYNASPTITDNTVRHNSASNEGGGIYCERSSPIIRNNDIRSNLTHAGGGGGIICKGQYYYPTVAGNIIAYNHSSNGDGGGICSLDASPRIVNNTLEANGGLHGGGIYCYFGSPRIYNNIITRHVDWSIYCDGGTPVLRNNCLWNGHEDYYFGVSAGEGDIFRDPGYVDRYWGDLHLADSSPCIDAGWNDAYGLPASDLDGDPRLFNRTVDIGADEHTPVPMRVRDAKDAADASPIYLRKAIVSAAFSDFFYVEADDRSSGIRVDKPGHGLVVDTRASVYGIASTDSAGERHIDADLAANTGSGHVNPVGLANRNLGGEPCGLQAGVWSWQKVMGVTDPQWLEAIGLNNIGLLVTIWGSVTFSDTDCFYLDDGSRLDDGSGHIGVKVSAPGMSFPSSGCVIVTGVSSCEKVGSDLIRLLRVRMQDDIVPAP